MTNIIACIEDRKDLKSLNEVYLLFPNLENVRIVQYKDFSKLHTFSIIDTNLLKSYTTKRIDMKTKEFEFHDIKFNYGYIMLVNKDSKQIFK